MYVRYGACTKRSEAFTSDKGRSSRKPEFCRGRGRWPVIMRREQRVHKRYTEDLRKVLA